jgi:hypothetical protein
MKLNHFEICICTIWNIFCRFSKDQQEQFTFTGFTEEEQCGHPKSVLHFTHFSLSPSPPLYCISKKNTTVDMHKTTVLQQRGNIQSQMLFSFLGNGPLNSKKTG